MYYWTGNFIYDFLYFFIPLTTANFVLEVLQKFAIIDDFGINFGEKFLAAFIFSLIFPLFHIFINLFLQKDTQKNSILFTLLLFPFIL